MKTGAFSYGIFKLEVQIFLRLGKILCTALILLLSVPAFGSIEHFGALSVEVPSGWTAEQQGSVTIIRKLSDNSSVAVAVNSKGSASLSDIAEHLYTQMNGNSLEEDSDGDYTFRYKSTSGAEGIVILTDSGEGRYILISVSGIENEGIHDEFDRIIDSLDWNE